MSDVMKPLIAAACDGPLSADQARDAFEILFRGDATPAQIGGFLIALRMRGETVTEIAAAARAMRAVCVPVHAPEGAIDIVGTGGDGKHTLNISTATAFVVAGAGVPVAKHGNRNMSSKSGTADVQGQLGIDVMAGPEAVTRGFAEAGIGFMMAPVHHPAMRHVGGPRSELGTRTLFNLLGPLTNPAGVARQLTGTYARALIEPMAEVLRDLGSTRAWLVHGSDGTDEMTITGVSWVADLEDGQITLHERHPEEAGLATHPFEAIVGGDPAHNAEKLRALLLGEGGAYRDAVLWNAACALIVAGRTGSLREGAEIAAASIDSGAAARAVEALARISQGR